MFCVLAALTDSLAAALVAVEPGPERARFSGSVHGTTKCDGGTLVHLSPSGEQSPVPSGERHETDAPDPHTAERERVRHLGRFLVNVGED
ncbi:hypothetical protein F2P81_020561 [Scophthalmus maximus]|uniref:Secreted protein n=1 Tax=Scophthalmus maximus TaxID=52904 RepID=A0A6A4S8C8_SCOMX|nr:hypothetical protein F2P81_020561 [Scophthalmus maximus]